MHVIGSAKRNQVKELLKKPLSEYELLYTNSSVNDVYGYRTEQKLFGQQFTVVVAHNSDSQKKKEIKYAEKKKKILNGLKELKKKAEKESGKGRKMTKKGLCTAANEVIPKDLRTVFWYEMPDNGRLSFDYGIDAAVEKDYMNSFGKSAIFTDLHELSSTDIVKTYFAKNFVEDDFKFLKDKLLLPVPPFFVRKDNRARVHVFLCVMGMIFYRYLARKVKKLGLSIKELDDQLEGIRVAFVHDKDSEKTNLFVEDMNSTQAKLFSMLNLSEFLV
jgi:transposase